MIGSFDRQPIKRIKMNKSGNWSEFRPLKSQRKLTVRLGNDFDVHVSADTSDKLKKMKADKTQNH